jgi:hypothetical protein
VEKKMDNPLSELVTYLSKYDSVDLLETVAGLQLMPENIERTIRLEALAHIIASISINNSKPKISSNKLGRICNSMVPEEITRMEDPFETPFTDEISFFGGSYIVFPGYGGDSVFVFRHLLRAIFQIPDELINPEFISKARMLISAILSISDEIAHNIDLRRGIKPIINNNRVNVPKNPRLDQLKHTISFEQSSLVELLSKKDTNLSAIERLIVPLGSISISNYQIDNGELLIHPIVKAGDKYIFAIPGMLLWAARQEIIHLAIEYNVLNELAKNFNRAVAASVIQYLSYLGNNLCPISLPPPPEINCFSDAFFELDSDKIIYTIVFTDVLDNYDISDINGRWQTDGLDIKISNRLKDVAEKIFSMETPPNDILFLFLFQGVGRMFVLGMNEQMRPFGTHLLTMSASDLETVALLESGEPLTLWKYACASDTVRDVATIQRYDELDEFQLYRKNHYSYYFSDEAKPNGIFISPGGAGELRTETATKRDLHGAISYINGYIMDVIALHGDRKYPIYIPKPGLIYRNRAALLLEGFPFPIWIIGPSYENEDQAKLHARYCDFADAIGYWLWQFTPSLYTILQSIITDYKYIVINMNLLPIDLWLKDQYSSEGDESDYLEINADPQKGHIIIKFKVNIRILLERADNIGERYFMQQILHGFKDLLPEKERIRLSDDAIDGIIDDYMPVGIKKKIINIYSNNAMDLDPTGLPSFRKLQEADINELLDRLGNNLISTLGFKIGRIDDRQRTLILNNIVSKFYFDELSKLVSSLRPEGLLEWLINYHESTINNLAVHKVTTPTRIALFNSDSQMEELIAKEFKEINEAAVAGRFIIEYVAAQLPNGLRPMSYGVYDQLLAIGNQIINFGFTSDLIHNELADIKLSILTSGRLGSDESQFEKARSSYIPSFLSGEIVRRTNYFESYWRKKEAVVEESDFEKRIDKACLLEFGHSLVELLDLMIESLSIGQELNPVVACLPLDDLANRLAEQLGWQKGKVIAAIDFLSLKPRIDFFGPESPYRKEDIYPWRFNRSLSYIRRPFIIRNSPRGVEVLWGIRHLYDAGHNLFALITSGRLKANCKEMKIILSEINDNRAINFNNRVFNLFEQDSDLIVKKNIKKIGKKHVRDSKGLDLGDIDVLVANPKKRILEAIECKSLALARTPTEMRNEIENLFEGGKHRSIVERHQRRTTWIRAHLKEILLWLNIGSVSSEKWKVMPLIVTDIELMTPFLRKSRMDIISILELEKRIIKSRSIS